MKNWLRVILPFNSYLIAFVGLYLLATMGGWLMNASLFSSGFSYPGSFIARDAIVMCAACLYGYYRSLAFHPGLNSEYGNFLKQTAWTPAKPLPFGSAKLVSQDAFILCLFLIAIYPAPLVHPFRPFYGMMFGYLTGLFFILMKARLWRLMYLLGFGLGAVAIFWANPIVASVLLLALYAVAYLGIQKSLEVFHQSDLEDAITGKSVLAQQGAENSHQLVGWPFDVLSPQVPALHFSVNNGEKHLSKKISAIPTFHGVLISLLVGWYFFCAMVIGFQCAISETDFFGQLFSENPMMLTELVPSIGEVLHQEVFSPGVSRIGRDSVEGLFCVLLILAGVLALSRLISYGKGHHPPISLWGRMMTFRFIIPGYDKIFVAPATIFLVLISGYLFLYGVFGISPLFAGPIMVIFIVMSSLIMGPSRTEWQLTAPCQIVCPYGNQSASGNGTFKKL